MKRVAGALSVRPLPSYGGTVGGAQDTQAFDIALRDPVRRIPFQGLLVGIERLAVPIQLGEGLAEAVVPIDVGAELEQGAVGVDRGFPLTARRLRDRCLAQLAALSGRGVGFSKCHGR